VRGLVRGLVRVECDILGLVRAECGILESLLATGTSERFSSRFSWSNLGVIYLVRGLVKN